MKTLIYNGSIEAGYVVEPASGMAFNVSRGLPVELPEELADALRKQAPHEWIEQVGTTNKEDAR